jgi:predicted AlkP superfamily phosphohydrolase/phosphomutase
VRPASGSPRTIPRTRRLRLAALALAAATSFGSGRAEAWGFLGHRLVHEKAVATLPLPLRALFEGNQRYVVEHSIDPDLWRNAGREGEAANHFLDLDAFGSPPFDSLPRVESEHLARHGEQAREKGRVPWRVAEVYAELVEAFRARDFAAALERAAALGHYVADCHVPLHAVLNYDGQLTGQKGLHGRWESEMVERYERQLVGELRPEPARIVEDPVALAFDVLLESFSAAASALEADRQLAGRRDYVDTAEDDRHDDAYYSRLFEREGERAKARLSLAATNVGSLWLSAWRRAGSPQIDTGFRLPYVRGTSRAILVTLDGASAPVIDDAVARGVMPNLAKVRSGGATAQGSITSLPAKTAAGHAAVFTGSWPDRNGIVGNEVPIPGRPVTESATGYGSTALRSEPIWVTAARQGLDVTVVSATQIYPFSPYTEERRFGGNYGRNLTLMDGYQAFEVPEALYTARELTLRPAVGWSGPLPARVGEAKDFDFSVAGARVDGLVYDDPDDPARGFDTMYLGLNKSSQGGITLKPTPAAQDGTASFASLNVQVRGGELGVHFRLFALSANGSEILLYRCETGVIRSNKAPVEPAVLKATGGFTGNGASHFYERGALGPTLWEGGDGTAELRYLETVRLVARQFHRLLEFGVERTRWSLLVAYLPYPDEALHTWLGHLDPRLPGHDPAVAARLRPFLDGALRVVDDYIGHLRDHAGGDTLLAVAADHGMIAVNRLVQLNVALQRAGLLAVAGDGTIDLYRTRAVYFPGNSGYFLVNRISRAQGIVRPDEEADVIRRIKVALREIRDPETGASLVTQVLDPRDEPPNSGTNGPLGGDLYFNLAPGYYPSAAIRGDVVTRRPPRGEHLLDPQRREMHAAFALSGPGVAAGVDLGLIRQIDIAPTLCVLLGIDPPAHATGTALRKALANPLPVGDETAKR